MNYLRELLYRPKRSDKSLIARFYFADLNLNAVAAELDSFDGRKDPERCSCLVNKLRSCQDKLLGICNKMLEEIEPGVAGRSREFRAKFPDDIMTDSLAGQLWFGAECLAAGSSIMNKERESDAMRPLAKAVTKSLEKVRVLLREQCLSPTPEYTEDIRENLKIFDRLFAEFEYSYVQCMVHVKSAREYELHQDLIVLFSDTLQRALKNEMVTQDMVDLYEPSLMFAVPRLAIVYGLLISPWGPLNVDKSSSDFPELFLPFKNLLRKIRELLLTLAPHEVLVLEMLLCQHEEPANISTKLKEVERMMEARQKSEESAQRLQDKLTDEDERGGSAERNQTTSQAETMAALIIEGVLDSVMSAVAPATEAGPSREEATRQRMSTETEIRVVEIDCTEPEIRVSPRRRSVVDQEPIPHSSSSTSLQNDPSYLQQQQQQQQQPTAYSPRPRQRLKRHNAKRDSRRIPLRYQKDRRAKFKSTDDLLHRLYVCISGAADQLQSNYAGDFRAILKNVFIINVTQDEEPEDDDLDDEDDKDDIVAEAVAAAERRQDDHAVSRSLPTPSAEFPVDLGTDALQQEIGNALIRDHLRGITGSNDELFSSSGAHAADGAASAAVPSSYALNLDMGLAEHTAEYSAAVEAPAHEIFFQPEPTLLDIADGDGEGDGGISESVGQEAEFVIGTPPRWVPDEEAPACMGCQDLFTLFKRRHHCRNCGLVYCNRCSGHSVPLPQFGMERPVRVCNRCYVLHQFPEDLLSPVGPNSGNSRFFSGGDSNGGRGGRNSSGGGGGGNNNPAASQHRNRRSPRSAPPSTSRSVPNLSAAASSPASSRQPLSPTAERPAPPRTPQQQEAPPVRRWAHNFGMVS